MYNVDELRESIIKDKYIHKNICGMNIQDQKKYSSGIRKISRKMQQTKEEGLDRNNRANGKEKETQK